ncbi:serine/threonine protein kinase, partial [Streptomyces sp. NPDC059101]
APEERYESCGGFVAALRAAGGGTTADAPAAGRAPTRVDARAGGPERSARHSAAPPPPPRWAVPVFPGPGTPGS